MFSCKYLVDFFPSVLQLIWSCLGNFSPYLKCTNALQIISDVTVSGIMPKDHKLKFVCLLIQ